MATAHHDEHPTGLGRWLFTTNHKDIGTLYLWFALTMFFVGGAMSLIIRAELWQPGLQVVNPHFFNQMTTVHALVMVFGAVMPAFTGLANWMIPMMIGAPDMALPRLNNWSFWLLPPAATLLVISLFVPGRRSRRRLDAVSAALDPDRHGHGLHHPVGAPARHVLDPRLDQHHRHDPEHARAGHDADENAVVCVDLAGDGVPAAGGDPGAGRRGDDVVDRSSLRNPFFQCRRRRRPGAVAARVLVLRPPGGVHPGAAGVRRGLADHPDVRAQAAVRLCVHGVRDLHHRVLVVHRLGAPHVHRRHAHGRRAVLHVRHHAHRRAHGREGVQLGFDDVARRA